MFSEKDLQALLTHTTDNQVLSVYLNTDPSEINTEAAKLRLRSLLKNVELPKDVEAIHNFVNMEYDWTGKGLVVFSNQAADFFQAFTLSVSVPDNIMVSRSPAVKPLLRVLDIFSDWGVVLVDKQNVRLFSFNLGELQEQKDITGEEVKQTKRGGGNTMPGRMGGSGASSNVESTIDKNIREFTEFSSDFFKKQHIRRIMIGGTEDNITRFMDDLPKSWQSLVVGNFPMSMNARHNALLTRATREALDAQTKLMQHLVDQSITLTAKGSHGVTGLIDTLNAIHEGRVKTLLVDHDFDAPGYRCKGCGYLTTQPLEKCPFCGGDFDKINNAVEMAVRGAFQKGADVKVVKDYEPLQTAGHIAAVLRY
jgi:peptide chain release factor subunit 1